jgi:hypothetical protein
MSVDENPVSYKTYRKNRIKELELSGYSYYPPDRLNLEEEGHVISPAGYYIDIDFAFRVLRKLRAPGKRIQIQALRALELIMLKECDDESCCFLYYC